MARDASELDISTKPKPRGCPVSRSVIKESFSTVPCGAKRLRTDSSVAVKGRLPTYNLVIEISRKRIERRRRANRKLQRFGRLLRWHRGVLKRARVALGRGGKAKGSRA